MNPEKKEIVIYSPAARHFKMPKMPVKSSVLYLNYYIKPVIKVIFRE